MKRLSPLIAWVRQPTTIAGLATLLGTASALLTSDITWLQALPLIIGALTGCSVNDNTHHLVVAPSATPTVSKGAPTS